MESSSSSEEQRNRRRAKNSDGEDKLKVIRLVNYCLKVTVDYQTYWLVDTSSEYDMKVSKNVAKMAYRMTGRIQAHTLKSFISISIVEFLKNFKLTCDSNGTNMSASMWLFYVFMNISASALLNEQQCTYSSNKNSCRISTLKSRYPNNVLAGS